MTEQMLDRMDPERNGGSPSLKPVRIDYRHTDGNDYILNLIDTRAMWTSLTVSRSLAAREGVVLVGRHPGQAQTLANLLTSTTALRSSCSEQGGSLTPSLSGSGTSWWTCSGSLDGCSW